MPRPTRPLVLGLAVAISLLGAACGDSDDVSSDTTVGPGASTDSSTTTTAPATSTTEGATVVGIIEASDQTGDGTMLVVDSVSIQGATGHIALHIDVDGGPGAVVGHASFPEGVTTDLEVPFDEPVESGTYWPMVHVDNGDGVYEFPGADAPLIVEDNPVMTPVVLTVE